MNKKFNLLLVEDNEAGSVLIRSFWEDSEEYSIDCVASVEKAFVSIKKQIPDLILLDIMLPEIDGLQFLKSIRESESYRNIPVIVISALDSEIKIKTAYALGALDFIPKPLGLNNFYPKVLTAIDRIKQQ